MIIPTVEVLNTPYNIYNSLPNQPPYTYGITHCPLLPLSSHLSHSLSLPSHLFFPDVLAAVRIPHYRTAIKLRAIQRRMQLHRVDVVDMVQILEQVKQAGGKIT